MGQWVYLKIGNTNIPWIFLFLGAVKKWEVHQILHVPWELNSEEY